ncbi:MAG: hypothetical protein JWO03_2383 [Bacteroidetes bacterium]|nr:hypothetical protein [Bacteroidota bacterium]
MTTEEKNRFDCIAVLLERSWENAHERRRIEYQGTIGVYTIFSLTILGVVLKVEDILKGNSYFLFGIVLVLGFSLLYLHYQWLKGIMEANDIDKRLAIHYSNLLQEISYSKLSILEQPSEPKLFKNWSLSTQWGLSWCFFIALVLILILKIKVHC